MSKIKLTILMSLMLVNLTLSNNVLRVNADVMDPKIPVQTVVTTAESDSNVMLPADPNITESTDNSGNEDGIENKVDEELESRQQDRALKKGVAVMDSIMYILGLISIIVPMTITAFYLCARVNPPVFARAFNIITLGKINYEEITVMQMLLRTIPIMVLGFMLATGQIRDYLRQFWYIILDKLGVS